VRLLLGSGLIFILTVLAGCGTRGLTSNAAATSSSIPTPATATSAPTSAGSLSTSNTVTVSAGENSAGIDITVSPSAGTENALVLGRLTDGFASNTGVTVHQATTNTIVLFGPGLSGSLAVTISGPQDIGVSNIRSVQAKDGTPGVAFDAVIGSSTAIGARTVYLKSANNDVTAFTGGLEVQP
jgi:hypothetical protein